jgi:DNA-binding transcriptional LysR family regulator
LRDPPPADDVVQEHLFDDVLAILMRPDHPLLLQPDAAQDEILRFPWIAPQPGSPLRSHYEALFQSAGLEPPRGAVECNSLSAARALLRASERLMLLSAHQISTDLAEGTLKILPHPRGRVIRRIGLTVRKGWRPTDIQVELIRLMRLAAARAARS